MPYLTHVCITRIEAPNPFGHRLTPLAYHILDESSSSNSLNLHDFCDLIERGAESLDYVLIDRIEVNPGVTLHFSLHPNRVAPVCLFCVGDSKCRPNQIQAFFNFMRVLYEDDKEIEGMIPSVREGGLQQLLGDKLQHEMIDFNKKMDSKNEKINDVQRQILEVKTVMSDNVARVLERGDRLENLDTRAEALQQSSQTFKTTAHRVQRNMCMRNLKWTIILGVVSVILLLIVIFLVLRSTGVL
ncbi:unnamed protein product [Bursaphelenchus xylophilus]|uniref:(pine wood nematode) hypothetical protein n=1 Tax=Bursaphelenchus xylophilus TaxID=6326 RepID=A0A1I7S440_BURXY|nr:unnamed protein product [Bursaphelenchus xylophilus]CAG9116694.1 unnamed protein product [Bursaphelenchus xylophilus]